VPQSNKQEKGLWARGVVLSFDFVTQDLRDNFSNSSQFQDEDWKKKGNHRHRHLAQGGGVDCQR